MFGLGETNKLNKYLVFGLGETNKLKLVSGVWFRGNK